MKPTAMLASIRSSEEEAFVNRKLLQLNIQTVDEQFVICKKKQILKLDSHLYTPPYPF